MILSIDPGIKNLSFCIIDEVKIYEWKNIDLNKFEGTMCEKLSFCLNNYDFSKCDIVLIERQPSINKKTVAIVHYLEMYFINYAVILYNSKNKLKHYKGDKYDHLKSKYYRNKKMSVDMCTKLILKNSPFYDFFHNSKKKDDLADCFLQATSYINHCSYM